MRTFARVTFIFNISFIAFVVLRKIEMSKRVNGNKEALIPLPFFETIIVSLGWSAIFVNLIFIITCIASFFSKKAHIIPKWLWWFNLTLLCIQVYYFFFYNP